MLTILYGGMFCGTSPPAAHDGRSYDMMRGWMRDGAKEECWWSAQSHGDIDGGGRMGKFATVRNEGEEMEGI